jgi:hypothetical protein
MVDGQAARARSKTRCGIPLRVATVCLVLVVGCLGTVACGRLAGRAPATSPSSTTQPPPSTMLATSATSTPGPTLFQVPRTTTNPILEEPAVPNFVALDTAVRSNGELLVFFPGTGGQPDCCQLFLKEAAQLGFHTIGLTYENTQAVGTICRNNLTCYGTVRQNDFDGTDASSYSNVAPAQSISARLVDMLGYLAKTYPSEGWASFLSGGHVKWNLVVVAGHSQGGGDAAYIAKIEKVEGVIMLSSDVDSTSTTPPVAATYLTTGHLTTLNRYTGFDHTQDPFYPKIRTDWTALNLAALGPAVSVDTNNPPYSHSHELVTSATVPDVILATHDSTAVDSATPLCANGTAEFAPVWRYMMEVAGSLPLSAGPKRC